MSDIQSEKWAREAVTEWKSVQRQYCSASKPLWKIIQSAIDDEDFDFLNQWKWHSSRNRRQVYAVMTQQRTREHVAIHRLIAGVPDGVQCDHKNGNGLDNRRSNLRAATSSQQQQNSSLRSDNKLGIKGVSRHRNKFQAQIKINQRRIYLGIYETISDAKKAYDRAAEKYFGEFRRIA